MEVEVVPTNTEITPNTTNGATINNNGALPTANSTSSLHPSATNVNVLPYSTELVLASSGQRIKLQVEVNSDYKFLTICDPSSTLADLKNQLEIEYTELYPIELPIVIVRLQDSRRNDKDKVYVVLKPIINPEEENAEANSTPAPRQRGRKRKNQDHKDIKVHDTPNKKPTLSSLSPSQHSPSQPPTPTQLQQQLQLQQQQLSQITPYSPGAKVTTIPTPSAVQERVVCNPYCALIDSRDNVPCQHCGELRPYVVPDSEKTDRNQCSKWCVTGSTRKLKAAGLEFCSICLARHRAGKYDLRKAHQCLLCHRPWLHLDEYMYCRTCRKSAMGTDKEPQLAPPMILSNPLSILSGNGAPMHLTQQQHIPQHQSLPTHLTHQQPPLLSHSRIHSPTPQHITLHDLHKRTDLEKKGEPKTQSIPLQQLHHFQQQSQQLLGVNSPPHHSSSSSSSVSLGKDDGKEHDPSHIPHDESHHHHHHTQEHHHHHEAHDGQHHHDAQQGHAEHGHAEHTHAEHTHSEHADHGHAPEAPSEEQLAEMVLSQIPATGQEGEPQLGNSYYDPTIPIAPQEKVGS